MPIIIVFIFVFLITTALGGAIYLIYLPLKKKLKAKGKLTLKTSRRINHAYISLLIIFITYQTFIAFVPREEFYKAEFEYNTGIEFPTSAKFIIKDSEYPDTHGDYWATAKLKLTSKGFLDLKSKIVNNKDFIIDSTSQPIGITTNYKTLFKNVASSDIEIVFKNEKKEWFKIAFLKDGLTIIFERASS